MPPSQTLAWLRFGLVETAAAGALAVVVLAIVVVVCVSLRCSVVDEVTFVAFREATVVVPGEQVADADYFWFAADC